MMEPHSQRTQINIKQNGSLNFGSAHLIQAMKCKSPVNKLFQPSKKFPTLYCTGQHFGWFWIQLLTKHPT